MEDVFFATNPYWNEFDFTEGTAEEGHFGLAGDGHVRAGVGGMQVQAVTLCVATMGERLDDTQTVRQGSGSGRPA
jgi:hypothetical protein